MLRDASGFVTNADGSACAPDRGQLPQSSRRSEFECKGEPEEPIVSDAVIAGVIVIPMTITRAIALEAQSPTETMKGTPVGERDLSPGNMHRDDYYANNKNETVMESLPVAFTLHL